MTPCNRAEINERKQSLFYRIWYGMDSLKIRLFVLLSILSGFVPIFYNGFIIGCQLMFFQNILMPILITAIFLRAVKTEGRMERLQFGLMVGGMIGAIPAFISLTINNFQYYFGGIREAEIASRGGVVGPVTLTSVLYVLASQLLAFVLLTGLSGLMGIIVSQFPLHPSKRNSAYPRAGGK